MWLSRARGAPPQEPRRPTAAQVSLRRPGRYAAACALAALLALPVVCFLPAALRQGVFFVHDIQFYFYPVHAVSAAIVGRGELPLWNPYAYGGMPLLGDIQTALFYPPSWLFFVLPPETAFSYAVLLQFFIAGFGMYLFLRDLQLDVGPALLGAVSFMFCGFMTARVVHLSILGGSALIPWAFLCVQRALRGGRAHFQAAAAAVVALQVFAGHPQVPIYTSCALALFTLAWTLERRRCAGPARGLYRIPARLLIILGLGYGLAAVQLLPLSELVAHSHRSGRLSYDFIFGNSAGLSDWFLLVFPFAFGSLRKGLYAEVPISDPRLGSPLWEHSSYVGIFPLALAALVLVLFVSRLRRAPSAVGTGPAPVPRRGAAYTSIYLWGFLLALVGLCMVVASGRNTPFSYILYLLPVIGKLRDIERAMGLADFALGALAAIGWQVLSASAPPFAELQRRHLRGIAMATLAVPILGLLALRIPPLRGLVRPQILENLVLTRSNALVPLALAVAAACLLLWIGRQGQAGRVSRSLGVGLVLLDLGSYAAAFNPTTDPGFYQRSPQVMTALGAGASPFRKATFLPEEQIDSAVAKESLAIGWGMVYGVEDVNGFSSMQPRRYIDYLLGPDMRELTNGLLGNEQLLRAESPILSSLSAKYLLVPSSLHPPLGRHLRLIYRNAQVAAYENLAVYPRAYFTKEVRLATDPAVVLRAVRADGFDGRQQAFVEAPTLPALPATAPQGLAELQERERTASSLRFTTRTTETRLLVLSEMYFPGWQAFIDGVETPIYRTNYVFRGVVVPPGEHALVFRYRPRSVILGAVISGSVLLLLLLLIGLDRRRQT